MAEWQLPSKAILSIRFFLRSACCFQNLFQLHCVKLVNFCRACDFTFEMP